MNRLFSQMEKDFAAFVNSANKFMEQQKAGGTQTLEIGDYAPELGVFAGYLHGKQVWVGMNDEPKQMTWNEAMEWTKENNKHIPLIDELTLAYLHKDEINAALEANGGEPLKEDDWYWSSSESVSNYSWLLNMNNGDRYDGTKTLNAYVRSFQLI